MLNEMAPGALLLYYHSNCKRPGVAGLAKVAPMSRCPQPGSRAPLIAAAVGRAAAVVVWCGVGGIGTIAPAP